MNHLGGSHCPNLDRLAPELRVIALLDGGLEGVHVDMDDLADAAGRVIACTSARASIGAHIRRMLFRFHAT